MLDREIRPKIFTVSIFKPVIGSTETLALLQCQIQPWL